MEFINNNKDSCDQVGIYCISPTGDLEEIDIIVDLAKTFYYILPAYHKDCKYFIF